MSTVAEDLGVKGNTDRLLCDNQAAAIVCKTGFSKENSRLIFSRYWLIRSLLANGDATIEHIPGTANKADFFTKLFSVAEFKSKRDLFVKVELRRK